MISISFYLRKSFQVFGLLGMFVGVTACQIGGGAIGNGPSVRGQTVQVAMLLPVGSGQAGDAVISRNLENAARIAAADISDVSIDITVYDTAGQAARAATVAAQAVSNGADVIVGPLRSDAAAAVGVAVANSNVNVLSFSNNTEIAGGNVFVLGHTFANTANRIVRYAASRGRDQIVVTHAENLAGQVARDAVVRAAQTSGATILGVVPYEFSQTGVTRAVPQIVDLVRQNGAEGLMLTSLSAGALPFFAQLLPENGLDITQIQLMGLARWDTPPQILEFDGLQGGWFAVPDPSAAADFNARYSATYGESAHILAALGYDAVLAVGATASRSGSLSAGDFVSAGSINGANGVFRLLRDGTNQRAMAIAQILNNQVAIIDPAPRRLGGFGS